MRAAAAIALLLVALGAATLALLPWLAPEAPPPGAGRPDPPPLQAEAFAPPAPPPGTDLAPFLARPPFSAARRPPPPEAPGLPLADPGEGLLFGRYEVAGVVMLGPSAVAMLRDREGRLLRLRAGESLETPEGPAELLSVGLDALTFRRAGATVSAPVGRGGAESE